MTTVISVENLSKSYRLGVIGTGTLRGDVERWWARIRKRPDPAARVDEAGASQDFGEFIWALKDIDLSVQQGEAVGIIGANGAGKSTLLKILSRLTAPTSGTVRLKGRLASLIEVGVGFHPELTGRENVYLNGAILGMSRPEVNRRFDEILDFSGIERYIDTPVKRYSSGMYVRLGFAIAAHMDSDILIVDEVLAVGDLSFQRKCLDKIDALKRDGHTNLLVTHNLSILRQVASRVIWLDHGKLMESGVPDEVVSHYTDYMLSGINTVAKKESVIASATQKSATSVKRKLIQKYEREDVLRLAQINSYKQTAVPGLLLQFVGDRAYFCPQDPKDHIALPFVVLPIHRKGGTRSLSVECLFTNLVAGEGPLVIQVQDDNTSTLIEREVSPAQKDLSEFKLSFDFPVTNGLLQFRLLFTSCVGSKAPLPRTITIHEFA